MKKLIAVLLAIWLPLFSGAALASSVAMPSKSGGCHVAQAVLLQQGAHQSQHVSTEHRHMLHDALAGDQGKTAGAHGQHDSSHKDCGVCQLACCGFMATLAIEVAEIKISAQQFVLSSTQFQSFYSTPLVPPPLARA